jgi:hypothetical protein
MPNKLKDDYGDLGMCIVADQECGHRVDPCGITVSDMIRVYCGKIEGVIQDRWIMQDIKNRIFMLVVEGADLCESCEYVMKNQPH